jgi:hypothetical protein
MGRLDERWEARDDAGDEKKGRYDDLDRLNGCDVSLGSTSSEKVSLTPALISRVNFTSSLALALSPFVVLLLRTPRSSPRSLTHSSLAHRLQIRPVVNTTAGTMYQSPARPR